MSLFSRKPETQETDTGLTIESAPEDAPAFKRIYKARLNERARITVTCRTVFGRRMIDGELTQPNGSWVLFDPDNIADKILDQVLVPLVRERVEEIERRDRQFIDNDPGEFVDERGSKWQRV